jgi:hypothetical protein
MAAPRSCSCLAMAPTVEHKEERTSPWPCLPQPPPFLPSFPRIYFLFLFLVSFLIGARKQERAGRLGKRVSSACEESERDKQKLKGCSNASREREREEEERREKVLQLSSRVPLPCSGVSGRGFGNWCDERDRVIIFSSCLLFFWGYVRIYCTWRIVYCLALCSSIFHILLVVKKYLPLFHSF